MGMFRLSTFGVEISAILMRLIYSFAFGKKGKIGVRNGKGGKLCFNWSISEVNFRRQKGIYQKWPIGRFIKTFSALGKIF